MSQVLLRDGVEDLRGHLRAGRYSDALALGRHVLHFFPRHLETYRLLAETHLELNEPDAAADLYNRVRSADPESVVALLGLSVVHERRGETDEAIWHLERAFEIEPSNAELRRELTRLAGRGEPGAAARAKLPPSGLARLYARQGLNAQAIREFRALLRADPERLDLQVALMQVLFRDGQLQEAARGAQSILQSLPYCLKANLILGKLWSDNGVPEGQELLKLARSLDPELLVAREMQIDLGEFAPPTLPAPEGIAITAAPVTQVPVEPAISAPEEEPGTSGPLESPADV
ncbi:MAG: tetratricopeptide repeat protein, partial [Rudaea sp.]